MRSIFSFSCMCRFYEEARPVTHDDMFDNREAKACAFFLRWEVAGHAVKSFADSREMRFRKAWSLIGNDDAPGWAICWG